MHELTGAMTPVERVLAAIETRRKDDLNRKYGDKFSQRIATPDDEINFQIDSNYLITSGAKDAFKNAFSGIKKQFPDAKLQGPLRPDKAMIYHTSMRITFNVSFGSRPFNYWVCDEIRAGVLLIDDERQKFHESLDPSIGGIYFYGQSMYDAIVVPGKRDEIEKQLADSLRRPYKVAIYRPTLKELLLWNASYKRPIKHFEY